METDSSNVKIDSSNDQTGVEVGKSVSYDDSKDLNDRPVVKLEPDRGLISSPSANGDIRRVCFSQQELSELDREQWLDAWHRQDLYIEHLEQQLAHSDLQRSELISCRELNDKLKQQLLESTRRENIHIMRLTQKENEIKLLVNQIHELKRTQVPTTGQLRTTLVDPAVNLIYEKVRSELDSSKAKVEEMQNELSAWKFTADSQTGKKLMAKCRLLYQENEELGKLTSSGRIAKLEGELALQRCLNEEMKKSHSELDEFLVDLDEEADAMQATIYHLQQQLKEARQALEGRNGKSSTDNSTTAAIGDSIDSSVVTESTTSFSAKVAAVQELPTPSSETASSSTVVENGNSTTTSTTIVATTTVTEPIDTSESDVTAMQCD